jgi:hypothetical protein
MTLYKISLFDMVLTILTKGAWILFIIWFNEVEESK